MDIVIATNNQNKVKEFKEIFKEFDINVYSLKDLCINVDPEETGSTYEENSLIKAKAVAEFTDKVIIADDSGFNVEALPNELGIHSHRFYGENTTYKEKCEHLIEILKDETNRNAYFICCITLLNFEEKPVQFIGKCVGKVATELRGTGGFGYDPVFMPNGLNKTMAELGTEYKNVYAHRGLASKQLVEYLRSKGVK